MSAESTESVRVALEAERDLLHEQLDELGHGEGAGLTYDPNFADTSQVTAERGETAALAQSLRETYDQVLRALSKLDDGTYGVCERCGEAISSARLEAKPTADRCINCASS